MGQKTESTPGEFVDKVMGALEHLRDQDPLERYHHDPLACRFCGFCVSGAHSSRCVWALARKVLLTDEKKDSRPSVPSITP